VVQQIVVDTNVLIAALRSRRGASFRLLSILGTRPDVRPQLSVPLVLEYEATAVGQAAELGLTVKDIGVVLDYLCSIADHHEIFYLWRPVLRDPKDDMVLELAVAAGCRTIVTYNKSDFQGAEAFGIRVETAREFLVRIGELT
jgi:putative PIN family toxin of toxin-antitoxin system